MGENIEERCEHARPLAIDNLLLKIGIGTGELCKCKNPEPCHESIDMGYPWPFHSHYCGVEIRKGSYSRFN